MKGLEDLCLTRISPAPAGQGTASELFTEQGFLTTCPNVSHTTPLQLPPPRLAEMQDLPLMPLGSPGHPNYQAELLGCARKLILTDPMNSEDLMRR